MDLVWMIAVAIAATLAGRSPIRWAFLAYFVGWYALLAVFLLPMKPIKQLSPEIKERIESYFAKKEFNNFNTVDDLFKQLETPRG
jgi:ATP/ADP translocase